MKNFYRILLILALALVLTVGVDLLGLRVLRREIGLIADFDDLRALKRDSTGFIVAFSVRVARDDAAICE